MPIEYMRQAPIEEEIFVDCYVCESNWNFEDMTVVHYCTVCPDCVAKILKKIRPVVHNCKFCGFEYPDWVATIEKEPFWVCEDCKHELN